MIRLAITLPARREEYTEDGQRVAGTTVIVEVDPDEIHGAQGVVDGAMRLGDILRRQPLVKEVRRLDERVRAWVEWP